MSGTYPKQPRDEISAADWNAVAEAADLAWQRVEDLSDLAEALAQIYLGTMTLTQPLANSVHQRTTRSGGLYSLGAGPVPLVISCTEPPTRLDYRLRDATAPATVLLDWTTLDFQRVTGSQTVSPSVPAGLEVYLIDIRPNQHAAKIVSTTNAVMVGELIGLAGQSWAQDLLTPVPSGDATTIASAGLTISGWGRVFAAFATNSGAYPAVADFGETNYPPAAWQLPSDAGTFDGTGVVELINRIVAEYSVPVGVVGYAVGGTGIESWLPGYDGPGDPHYEKLIAVLDAAGLDETSTLVWFQGHYESKNGNTAENYAAQLEGLLITSLRGRYGAGLKYVVGTIPGIGSYSGTVAGINMVRETAIAFVADYAATMQLVDCMDATQDNDLVHAGQTGNILVARAIYRAFGKLHGLADYGARGPLITGASRDYASADIVLAIDQQNGGTAWVEVGDCIDQFAVYPAGTTSGALTISDIITTDPAELIVRLSTAPPEAAYDLWYRRSPDTADQIDHGLYDNVTDGDGITQGRQLAMTGAAIPVAYPVAVMTMAAISDGEAGTAIAVSGTYSNGLPSALEYSADGGTTWTAASGETIGAGAWSFSIGSGLPVGAYRLIVRDVTSLGSATSGRFVMAQASPATLPTIADHVFSFSAANADAQFYTDTGRTVPAVIGDTVRGLADKSGTGNHFSQATAARAPALAANVANGLPGLRFTGTASQFMSLVSGATLGATLKAATNYTILAVYTPADLPAIAYTVFAAGERAKSGGFNIMRAGQGLASGVGRASRNSDSTFYQPTVTAGWVVGRLNKEVVRYTGAGPTLKVLINALAEGSVATAGVGANAWDAVRLGAEGSNSVDQFFLNGWIHQLEIWTTASDDTVRDALAAYATDQWGA